MYVCICNALTEDDLNRHLNAGVAASPADFMKKAGCKPNCGVCLDHIEETISKRTVIDEGSAA